MFRKALHTGVIIGALTAPMTCLAAESTAFPNSVETPPNAAGFNGFSKRTATRPPELPSSGTDFPGAAKSPDAAGFNERRQPGSGTQFRDD